MVDVYLKTCNVILFCGPIHCTPVMRKFWRMNSTTNLSFITINYDCLAPRLLFVTIEPALKAGAPDS